MAMMAGTSRHVAGGDSGDSHTDLALRVELLADYENVETASNFHDAELNEEESTDRIDGFRIQKMINDRCNKVTSLYLDDTGLCTRYAYYQEGSGIPVYEAHNRVIYNIMKDSTIMQLRLPVVETSMQSKWLTLNEKAKDMLYVILYAANSIWKRIHFDVDREKWIHRSCKHNQNDVHSTLVDYGMSKKSKCSILDILAHGRSKENMKKTIRNIKDALALASCQRLDDVWVSAFTAGMMNGTGQAAVYMLLDMICALTTGFEKKYPAIAVTHVTSQRADDAFSITSSNPSKLQTRSSSNSPAAKRRKMNYEKRSRVDESDSDSEDEVDFPKCKAGSKGEKIKRITWPKRNRQCVDLRVVTLDVDSGIAKYVVVGEILCRGKTLLQASMRFTKELVHVLQLQSLVFGLLFTPTSVLLYRAQKDAKGRILISHETYVLVESHRRKGEEISAEENNFQFFRVAEFQKVIMDIFTCVVYGMDYIDA